MKPDDAKVIPIKAKPGRAPFTLPPVTPAPVRIALGLQPPGTAQSSPAAPGSAPAPASGPGGAAAQNAAPDASQAPPAAKTPQVPCKTCGSPIWVRKGKQQDYCGATCKAQAELNEKAPADGACHGCRKMLPESKRGRRYCGNSCRARASERRQSETLASTSIIGWQRAFETSRRENDALVQVNVLLQEKLAALIAGPR